MLQEFEVEIARLREENQQLRYAKEMKESNPSMQPKTTVNQINVKGNAGFGDNYSDLVSRIAGDRK